MAASRRAEFVAFLQESTWATAAVGTYLGLPFESYEVGQSNNVVVREKMTGFIDALNVDQGGQILRGSAQAEVHPDNATNLLKTIPGIARSTVEGKPNWIPSYTIKFFDAAMNRYMQHLGIMVDTLRISCGGLDGELMANYDLIGKNEEPVASFSQPTMPDQASFQMKHLAGGFTVAGIAEPNIESFEITVNNNLRPGERPDANGRILWLDAGVRDVSCRVTLRTHTDFAQDYDGLVRGQNTGVELKWVFNYPGTGSPVDSVTITLPLCVLSEAPRGGSVRDMQSKVLNFTCKRSASSDAITIATA